MYLSHFNDVTSALLPAALLEMKPLLMDSSVLRTATRALAASDLAEMESSIVEYRASGTKYKSYALSQVHMRRGINYYDSAICAFSKSPASEDISPQSRLTAALLFAYFEWQSRSPKGFFIHLSGANDLVADQYDTISRSPFGSQLLSCWATLYARQSLHRLPFRPLYAEKAKLSNSIHANIRPLAEKFATSHQDKILVLMCDSHCMNARMLLEICMRSGNEDTSATIDRSVAWYGDLFRSPFVSEEENKKDRPLIESDELLRLLVDKRQLLDEWHASLENLDLPMERFTSDTIGRTLSVSTLALDYGAEELAVHPLKFHSHTAATTYLFYSVAQLLSSEQRLMPFTLARGSSHSTQQVREEINPWAYLILRIIAGFSKNDWLFSEPYQVGILTILAFCCTYTPDNRFTQYVLSHILPRIEEEVQLEPF
jgi:hypothetical protein